MSDPGDPERDQPGPEPASGSRPPFVAAHPGTPPFERERRAAERSPQVPARARGLRRGGTGRMLVVALAGVITGGLIFAGGYMFAALRQPAASPSDRTPSASSVVATDALEAAAAKLLPSVVNVAVESSRFSGIGSGVIIRSDGYILTNYHVVEGATRVTVRLGATDVPATVVGTDPTTDIAVIKVAKTGLPAATIGSSASLRVGETVLAIGSPFGLDKTVTSGIVSALHRSNLSAGGVAAYTNLIQTDAPITPGNSGGALADLTGALIGVNTLIQSPSGVLGAAQSAGIGFAIPIDFAKPIADLLIAGKKVTHPFLGVASATVTPAFARLYGLSASTGALVQEVSAGSPAAAAGIVAGDIIVKVGTQTVTSAEDMFVAVQTCDVGVPLPVVVARGSGTTTLTVTLVSK
jgi:putative serine protease PepD